MAGRVVFDQRIEDQWHLWRVHALDAGHSGRRDDFRVFLSDLVARFDNDLARTVMTAGIDHIVNRDLAF